MASWWTKKLPFINTLISHQNNKHIHFFSAGRTCEGWNLLKNVVFLQQKEIWHICQSNELHFHI